MLGHVDWIPHVCTHRKNPIGKPLLWYREAINGVEIWGLVSINIMIHRS